MRMEKATWGNDGADFLLVLRPLHAAVAAQRLHQQARARCLEAVQWPFVKRQAIRAGRIVCCTAVGSTADPQSRFAIGALEIFWLWRSHHALASITVTKYYITVVHML